MQGRSQDFSKGGGGHTVSNIIVMAFSPRNVVGCLLKKRLTKGGVTPGAPPSLRPCSDENVLVQGRIQKIQKEGVEKNF